MSCHVDVDIHAYKFDKLFYSLFLFIMRPDCIVEFIVTNKLKNFRVGLLTFFVGILRRICLGFYAYLLNEVITD